MENGQTVRVRSKQRTYARRWLRALNQVPRDRQLEMISGYSISFIVAAGIVNDDVRSISASADFHLCHTGDLERLEAGDFPTFAVASDDRVGYLVHALCYRLDYEDWKEAARA